MTKESLHWLTDPLLFDHEPVAESKWLTANGLIRQQRTSEIFLWNKLLHLHPIMVRRGDFLQGERLLQTMPYLLLDERWAKKIRNNSLALAERCYYYFNGSTANFSILQ